MTSRQQRRDRLIFLVPSMTVLTVILFYPLAYSIGLSFYNYYLPVPRTSFVGLDNFRFILGDYAFWEALGVTARFTAAAVALLLDSRIPCRRFVNIVVLLPMAITPAVAGLLIRWMFESNWGLVNYFLSLVGVQGPGWTGDPAWALWSIVFADVSQNTPFVILVIYAGLQSVPMEPLEAPWSTAPRERRRWPTSCTRSCGPSCSSSSSSGRWTPSASSTRCS